MLTVNTEETKSVLPLNMRDSYIVRCIDPVFKTSSKGNPMYALKWELVGKYDPKTRNISQEIQKPDETGKLTVYNIAGFQFTTYHTLIDKAAPSFFAFVNGKLGFDWKDIDENNPPTEPFKDLCVHAILASEEVVERQEQTAEQKSQGKPGDPIIGPDGNHITRRTLSHKGWIGRCDPELEKAIQTQMPY